MSRWRDRLKVLVLLPLVVVAVGVLAYFTVRTTLQIDTLRQQSVLEATLGLATEKANRVDRQIIDQDNVVMAIADPARLEVLTERWLPTAQRETPSVRAILVLDESRTVLAFASRATGALAEEEGFRRLLVARMLGDMELGSQPPDELRHLHREYAQQGYLLSYWQRVHEGRRYFVIAWHDIGRIVRETLPMLYAEPQAPGAPPPRTSTASRVNVVDEEGRIIYGPPLRSGEFTVGVRFPTTLYNWRVQVSPQASEELTSRVENRRLLEILMVSLSCIVIIVGAIAIVLVAEKERRVSALKSEFVANVSHELKTPLALVRMFAEMLQSGRVQTDAKKQEYLDVILRESERLSALIENVLDFARLERGRGSYEFAEGDVGDAVTRAANVYRYRAEREGVNLVVAVEADLPRARIDERAIQLAVINLVDNALKYAPDGESITIRAKADHGGVRVEVTDEGPGIAPEDRQRIFERFVRLRSSAPSGAGAGDVTPHPSDKLRSPVRGSGIGLALVKHIAESHGGRAWVDAAPGAGSTFIFTIPARRVLSVRPAGADDRARPDREPKADSDTSPQRVS
ncbi:MAG: HAMP domain-containing histidine kinase [Labilithrix sp.]|nr:HAMP domain-containing histidine kinase [Labilithrix sp.]